MSETQPKSLMASKVSDEIFEVFGWHKAGPQNVNWHCVLEEHEVSTHPSDVVFWYEDPYRNDRIYLNTDLKSYAKNSITKSTLAKHIRSLGKATSCANISPDWQSLYNDCECNSKTVGLLFIYNHDDEYDGEGFSKLMSEQEDKTFDLTAGNRMYIIGPQRVSYLATVANDIRVLQGRQQLPLNIGFCYPHLIRFKSRTNPSGAATIETLLGPWQVILCDRTEGNIPQTAYLIYYANTGSTEDEFIYLLDFILRYQLLDDRSTIKVRIPFAATDAVNNFAKARERYARHQGAKEDLTRLLTQIECSSVTSIIKRFSETEIGME